jgi:hypothetical protein
MKAIAASCSLSRTMLFFEAHMMNELIMLRAR